MPGTYPPAASAIGYFPAYDMQGWAGTPTTTPIVLTIKSGNHPAYFSAYKACTIYEMSACCITTNSTAAILTLQPWGSLTAGGTAAAIGTGANISVPSSGPFVAHAYVQSISLAIGGFVGISVSSSVSNSAVWINVNLWAAQAGS